MPFVGGQCEYAKYEGICTISKIAKGSQPDRVVLHYDFRLKDLALREEDIYIMKGLKTKDIQLKIGGWKEFARAAVEEKGLAVGTETPCERQEIIKGTCTPSIIVPTALHEMLKDHGRRSEKTQL